MAMAGTTAIAGPSAMEDITAIIVYVAMGDIACIAGPSVMEDTTAIIVYVAMGDIACIIAQPASGDLARLDTAGLLKSPGLSGSAGLGNIASVAGAKSE